MSSRALSFAALALAQSACSGPDSTTTIELASPESLNDFRPLEAAMGPSCGSLDCHGQPGRNLRIYDARGLRYAPTDVSGVGTTTATEVSLDEDSVLALEPQATKEVLDGHGANLDALLLVLKARGAVEHKGGTPWPQGSHGDRCLVAWLSSATSDGGSCACAAAEASSDEGSVLDPDCNH